MRGVRGENRLNGFRHPVETVETVFALVAFGDTPLKRGANEIGLNLTWAFVKYAG